MSFMSLIIWEYRIYPGAQSKGITITLQIYNNNKLQNQELSPFLTGFQYNCWADAFRTGLHDIDLFNYDGNLI